jgi:heme oxygenase
VSASPIPLGRLSHVLRASTAAIHRQTELALDLPASIRGIDDYCFLLQRFYGLYEPLEELLATFPEWTTWKIALPERRHTEHLGRDLRALGVAPQDLPRASPSGLPKLQSFAEALGARYVLEGSALGSQIILPLLQRKLHFGIDGADSFLRGYGNRTQDHWIWFCAGLDRFGAQPGAHHPLVCVGALATFAAVGAWLKPQAGFSLTANIRSSSDARRAGRNESGLGGRLDRFS